MDCRDSPPESVASHMSILWGVGTSVSASTSLSAPLGCIFFAE
jgi:hypothetical protein